MKTIALLSGAALFAIAGLASAQPGGPRPERMAPDAEMTRAQVVERTDQAFARLDGNNDGRFTREEARAMGEQRRAQRAERMFDRLDVDRNGSITREEMSQARAQRQAHRAERRAEGGPGMRGGHGMRGHRGMRGAMHRGMRGGRMFGEQGFVTREQFRERALARFDRADADRNGVVTGAERREARHHRGPHPGGPGGPGAPGDRGED